MRDKKSEKGSFLHRYATPLLLLLVVVFLGVFLAFVRHSDTVEIGSIADETLDFMRSVCIRYDNYAVGRRASGLKDLYDKTNGLAKLNDTDELLSTDYLRRFAATQAVTGVIVTDAELQPAAQLDVNGADAYALWQEFLHTDSKRNIVKYKNKSYTGTVALNGVQYRVSIVSRRDAKGVVLCYKAEESVVTDVYETSLAVTLENNTFHKNPAIVITDGETVIATNVTEFENGQSVADCPVQTDGEAAWNTNTLVQLEWQGTWWYGKRLAYEQYLIYVFYPAAEVYDNMLPVVTTAIAIYALVCLILMMVRHISEQKFRRREQRQLTTIRAISSLFVTTSILDLDSGTIEGITSTPRAQAVLDETHDADAVARLLAESIIAPEYREQYVAFLDRTTLNDRLRGKTSISRVCRDVSGTWFSVYLIPMDYDKNGQLRHVLFASRDINDFMQKEEQYRDELRRTAHDAEVANAAKTSFLRRMSHDLRTPVNGIRGMAVLAAQSLDEPEKARTHIDKILASSDYLQSILEDILRMSKLESGKLALEHRAFDLQQVIDETADFIRERADESGVHFALETQPLPHTRVVGSPLHLRQVMQNVLSNAVKFTPAGGSIRAACRELSCDGRTMQFEFVCTDTGIGMTEEFRTHVFEPFTQEADSARSEFTGTGLGLPIAKEILDLCGGTIEVASEKDKGSTFTVRVPLELDETAAPQQGTDSAPDSIEGVRILIAEDNEINMEIAHCMLESRGAVITEARNGREAVEQFEAAAPNSYDVILMDIMMPEMDGLEAARAIRAMPRPDAKEIPIFAMTANAFVDDINLSISAGMNEHLAKPLDLDKVICCICKYTRK